jgi:hypothetical protein
MGQVSYKLKISHIVPTKYLIIIIEYCLFVGLWQWCYTLPSSGKDKIVVSSLRVYYSVREENTCGVVINVSEMFVLF